MEDVHEREFEQRMEQRMNERFEQMLEQMTGREAALMTNQNRDHPPP